MKADSSYSPVLWGAILIPVVSGTELFIDEATRSSFPLFILGFFYLMSVRYTLAVALGVYAYEVSLKEHRVERSGALLWACYFMVLILCSLLVPGAAIFGLTATLIICIAVLLLSLIQGILSLNTFVDKQKSDIQWRMYFDLFLLILIIIESLFRKNGSYQSPFFGVAVLLIIDFTVSDFARSTLLEMYFSLRTYLCDSWTRKGIKGLD